MNHQARRALIVVGAAIYIVLFHITYVLMVAPRYSYMGLADNPRSVREVVSGSLLALLPALWVPIALKRPSQVVYWILYVLVIIPAAIVPIRANAVDPSDYTVFLVTIVACFAALGRIYSLPLLRLNIPRLAPRTFWTLIAFTAVGSFAAIVSTTGSQFHLVGLQQVYSVRASFKQTIEQEGVLFAYVAVWQCNVIYPLFMTVGLIKKQLPMLLLGFAGELFIYSITGFKSALFSGLLFFILLAALHRRGRNFGLSAIWGMVLILLASLAAPSDAFMIGLFLHRVLGMPGLLTGYYFDFFSHNPKAMLGYSILKPLVHYPYDIDVSKLIGRVYFRNPLESANVNIWGDAFCNFGYSGLLGFTVLLGLILWLFDSAAEGKDHRLVALMLGIPAFSLGNSGLLTCILSHGMGVALIIVYILPISTGIASDAQASEPP
jgi:hypothetical protein